MNYKCIRNATIIGGIVFQLSPSIADPIISEQPVFPNIVATVSIAEQKMIVTVGDTVVGNWKVSTASPLNTDCTENGRTVICKTPTGTFHPTRLVQHAYSTKWHSPMPNAVYFDNNGDAVHATYGSDEIDRLGQPASHGCVRVAPENAKIFYDLVASHRQGNYYPGITIIVQ